MEIQILSRFITPIHESMIIFHLELMIATDSIACEQVIRNLINGSMCKVNR